MTVRLRKSGESVREWLLPAENLQEQSRFQLEGALAKPFMRDGIELEEDPFDARIPPRIRTPCDWLRAAVDSNFTCLVQPVKINAPKDHVWRQILDLEHYHEWNPFHRQVKIVEDARGFRSVRMWVNSKPKSEDQLIPIEEASLLWDERILYVDERTDSNVLVYGLEWYLIPTLRVQVVTADGPNSCMYYSYDHFGGWVSMMILKFTAQATLTNSFTLAAKALKKRCESTWKNETVVKM